MKELAAIIRMIELGDPTGALTDLAEYLQHHPNEIRGWWLMASLMDDPKKKADCYLQVLRIDPANHHAADFLRELVSGEHQDTFYPPEAMTPDGRVMRCPQCGAEMELRFVGDMQDKRAVCWYCNTEIDIPDTYRRVKNTKETRPGEFGRSIVETTTVETRSDEGVSVGKLPSTVREMLEKVHDSIVEEPQASETFMVVRREDPRMKPFVPPNRRQAEFKTVFKDDERHTGAIEDALWTETRLHILQGVAPEERRACPKCKAVVSVKDTRCQWCDTDLVENPPQMP